MRMIDEDGLKEKPEDTRYIKNKKITSKQDPKHQENLIPTLPLLGLRTRESTDALSMKAPGRGVKCPGQVAPTTGS